MLLGYICTEIKITGYKRFVIKNNNVYTYNLVNYVQYTCYTLSKLNQLKHQLFKTFTNFLDIVEYPNTSFLLQSVCGFKATQVLLLFKFVYFGWQMSPRPKGSLSVDEVFLLLFFTSLRASTLITFNVNHRIRSSRSVKGSKEDIYAFILDICLKKTTWHEDFFITY